MSADVIVDLYDAIDAQDFERAKTLLTDDFMHTSTLHPEPIGGQVWLAALAKIGGGFSDFLHGTTVERVEGDTVWGTFRVTGRHTGLVDVPGLRELEPRGRAFALAPEPFVATVRDGRVAAVHVEMSPDGGIVGLSAQLRAGANEA